MPRYVILRHQLPHESSRQEKLHWDLMLESGGSLRTWALAAEPCTGADIEADQLPDHRLEYLDYEGPISANRGTVTRWDSGTYEIESDEGQRLQVTVRGRMLECRVLIRCVIENATIAEHHRWKVAFSTTPPGPDR